MANKEEELVALGTQGIEMTRPDFMEESNEGLENISQEDMQMPRLALAQKMSPEIDEGDPKYIDGLKNGDMFNGLTKQVFGKGPLQFVVLRADKPRGVEFIPREEGGGIKDPNVPLDDPRMQFGPNGEKPVATKFYDFIIVLLPIGEDISTRLVALSFKSTGLKTAKELNTLIRLRNRAVYAGVYTLTAREESNQHGKYFVYKVANGGWVADKTLYTALGDLSRSLAQRSINIQRVEEDEPLAFDYGANAKSTDDSGAEKM